jgi:hypothetical protein
MILRQKAKNYRLDQIRNMPNTLRAYKRCMIDLFAQPDVDDDSNKGTGTLAGIRLE